uniref:Uncharacterized protein n=1 Tax=Sphaerodactylus townsendi TaxID=933632 RepID=A0ACB8EXE4_9SAUR
MAFSSSSWLSPVQWAKWTWSAVRGGAGPEQEDALAGGDGEAPAAPGLEDDDEEAQGETKSLSLRQVPAGSARDPFTRYAEPNPGLPGRLSRIDLGPGLARMCVRMSYDFSAPAIDRDGFKHVGSPAPAGENHCYPVTVRLQWLSGGLNRKADVFGHKHSSGRTCTVYVLGREKATFTLCLLCFGSDSEGNFDTPEAETPIRSPEKELPDATLEVFQAEVKSQGLQKPLFCVCFL